MNNLKIYKAVLVGSMEDKSVFEGFFREIVLVKTNIEALEYYYEHSPPIIFFYCDPMVSNPVPIIKEIRKKERETILVIVSKSKNLSLLLGALPLHLSGYIQKPFEPNQMNALLENISSDLNFLYSDNLMLHNGYVFNREKGVLYNEKKIEIELTPHQVTFMQIIASRKDQYFSSEFIEFSIWEETSSYIDCNNRLKNLLYGLRKKLPKKSIVNSYKFGYKLVVE